MAMTMAGVSMGMNVVVSELDPIQFAHGRHRLQHDLCNRLDARAGLQFSMPFCFMLVHVEDENKEVEKARYMLQPHLLNPPVEEGHRKFHSAIQALKVFSVQ